MMLAMLRQPEAHLDSLVRAPAVGRLRRELRQQLPAASLLVCQRRPQPGRL